MKKNIESLVERGSKRNPFDKVVRTDAKFDFVQLGDLKKIIVSNINWKIFEEVFADKANFSNKMQEFIDLRNALRAHPRDITKIQEDGIG